MSKTLVLSNSFCAKRTVLSSDFLCYVSLCDSVEKANQFLKALREDHPKANHHCLAYRIGAESVQEFASDDGEPSGTAGLPMLGVLKRNDLVNVCVIVVRYFGGTKLGKKGLIEAYRESVEDAIEQIPIKPLEKWTRFWVQFGYERSSEIQKLVHQHQLFVIKEEFGENVRFFLRVSYQDSISTLAHFERLTHFGIQVNDIETYFE
jgi:uncharacterized YigZ family protein